MPRGIKGSGKSSKSDEQPRRRGRKPKEAAPAEKPASTPKSKTTHEELLREAEDQLVSRYDDINIIPGSLAAAGQYADFGKKRTVAIQCSACKTERRLCTSDLWSCRGMCQNCLKQARQESAVKKPKKSKKGKTGGEK